MTRPSAQSGPPESALCSQQLPQPLARIEALWWDGRDDQVEHMLERLLRQAISRSDREAQCWGEVCFAHWCLITDQDQRAAHHLAAITNLPPPQHPEFPFYLWLAQSRYARLTGTQDVPEPPSTTPSVPSRMQIAQLAEHAVRLCARHQHQRALALAQQALNMAQDGSICRTLALNAKAQIDIRQQREDEAQIALEEAITWTKKNQLSRLEARLLIRLALDVAPRVPGLIAKKPAQMLGRATTLLGPTITWRDRARIREGYRRVGRREQDTALSGPLATKSDTLQDKIGQSPDALSVLLDLLFARLVELEADPSRVDLSTVFEAVSELRRAIRSQVYDVVEAANSAVAQFQLDVVNRHRLRRLLDVFNNFSSTDTPGDMARMAVQLVRDLLSANVVILAQQQENGSYRRVAEEGHTTSEIAFSPNISPRLRSHTHPDLGEQGPVSGRNAPVTDTIVIPWSTPVAKGVVYASKGESGGRFTEQDIQLARAFTNVFDLAFGRQLAIAAKQTAIHELAATIDTIRDGVLALTGQGIVTELNSAAERMLRQRRKTLIGTDLGSNPVLAPLWKELSSGQRLDGTVVRLAHGSFVVTARPLKQGENVSGIVATLVELERARKLAHRLSATAPRHVFSNIIGNSVAIRSAIEMAQQAALADIGLLITGESGTGKEVFAQAIHTGGARAREPFVGLNCAAVPRELLEAELFGYERGAFTGARSEGNAGKFEAAGRGTMLLDEIGDMPLDMQAKLLRVLQERAVVRIGGTMERPVEARIIATTHRDLDEHVKDGRFRLDLFYRIRVLHIHLPPIRERGRDVILLAQHFIRQFAQQHGKRMEGLSPELEREFLTYPWPGNVRELANVILREVSLANPNQRILQALTQPLQVRQSSLNPFAPPTAVNARTLPLRHQIRPLAEVEKQAYLEAFKMCDHNVSSAARALGVSKVTFYKKLRSWGMHPKDHKGHEPA